MDEETTTATAAGTAQAALGQDAKTIEYTTGLIPPKFETQEVYDFTDPEQPRQYLERNRTKKSKDEQQALARASVSMLFSTDVSQLDDAGVKALYESVTEGVWGMPDSEGRFFGKRGSADDFRRNVDLLRDFFKGNYRLAQDPEAEKFREMSWDEKFRYALDHESAGNAIGSIAGEERGTTLGEQVYLAAVADAASAGSFLPSQGQPPEAAKEVSRKTNYDTMTPEEKRNYEADVIGDYERKLSKREPLYTYLRMAADLSDEGAYILAKSYNEDELDVPGVLGLPEEEQGKVMTTYAQMKGDLDKGRILGISTDFSTGTAGDRFQMGLYGLQQSVVSLGTDLYHLAEAGTMRLYAQMALDGKERSDFYRAWNAIERAKLYEQKNLPEADTFLGEAYQSFMENVHWIIPYGGAAKIAGKGKALAGAINAAKLQKELKTAGRLADLRQMMNVSLFSRMSPMADGMKYADETMGRLLASVDKYTRELQQLERMRIAYGAGKGALDAAWVAARGSAFAAFAQEYLETADAAGISREESVLTSVWVGLLNDRIEQLYVPGLESTLTKGQLKNLGMTAMRRSLQEGTFGTYARNFMKRYLTEGVRVGVTEGWIEEPLQQLVIEHGKQVDRVEGLDEKLKAFLKPTAKDLQTYLETATEMLPASFGFGVTTVPGQLMRRRIRNRWNARKTGLVNYDEGIVGLYQREIDVKKLIEASWQGKGEEEAERQDKPMVEEATPGERRHYSKDEKGNLVVETVVDEEAAAAQKAEAEAKERNADEQKELEADYRATDALTRAREIHETDESGDVAARIAEEIGIDVKTAEAVAQLLDEEAEVMRFDPRARSMVDQFFAGVRINEQAISTLLPGYVPGSFEADEANGVYVAKVKVAEDGGIAAGTRTIVYRRRDGVFFNPDGTLNEAELARAASRGSSLGVSYNKRIEQNGGQGLRWEELSDADRRREALILVNGRTDEAGTVAFRKKDGSEVTVRADAIVNLATGRLADIGYGMGAKQATVRHETFHALWMFAKELLKPEEVKKLADALAIDTRREGWETDLDEAMAHQMEEYASGHYVINAMSSRFEKFQAWAAKVFGGVDANRVLDPLSSERKKELGSILGEGSAYALEPFYNAVMEGRIGSGEMGIDRIVVPAKQTKKEAAEEDELPVEGAKDEPEAKGQAVSQDDGRKTEEGQKTSGGEPAPAAPQPNGVMRRQSWDRGTHVVKRVERKEYKIHCRLEVVNVYDGVRTSWDKGFDQANQGREMDDNKVAEIAGNLDYSKGGRVMEFTGKGAMLVAPNMEVLDGNHHTQGIRKGYRQGGEKADRFREECLAEARERGLAVSDHAAEAPVIVCVIESVEVGEGEPTPSIAEIASDTNETSQEELTSFAKVMKYAQVLIRQNLIPRFRIDPETGDIMDEEAKTLKGDARADPVGIFLQETHAKDVVKDNRITEKGQEILRASIIAAMLGGTDPETVKAMLARQKTLDMENEQRALMRMAPGLMALVNDPAKKDYDLRPDIVEALLWYQEWRDHDEEARRAAGKTKAEWKAKKSDGTPKLAAALGTTWANYKGDLFSKPGEAAQVIGDLFAASQSLRSFKADGETDTKAGSKRAQELIVRELQAYLDNVYATNTDTNDMFGDFTPPTKDQILKKQREKNGRYSVALYHGTGADFERPSLAHVGEGTGVAAQGHGFYLTDDYGWADFMGHQADNAGLIDSLIDRRYVYEFEYDGDTENLTHWVGPNPEAAERLMKVAKDAGLTVKEWFFADPDHTTGQRMERFLELATKPDGSKLTRVEMGELFVRAGIDGTQEYCGPGMYNTYVFYNVDKLRNVHKWHGKRQLYSVAYRPRPIPAEKVAEIVERFGVTDNIEESLWILPDGRMLRGVGRTYNIGGRAIRSFGHDDLTEYVTRTVHRNGKAEDIGKASRDIYASGFIRMTADSSGLYIAKRPTDEQFDALYDICDKAYQRMEADGLDEMFVDVEDENCNTVFTVAYRRGTSARRMIEDLKAWYDEGIVPEGATRAMYSTGRTWRDGSGNEHIRLHWLYPQKRHSESQMEGVRNQHELDVLRDRRRDRLFRTAQEEAYRNILEIGRIHIVSGETRSDFYEWAREKSRLEMEREIRGNVTDARVDAIVRRLRETGAKTVVGSEARGLTDELLGRVAMRGGFEIGASDRTAIVGVGTGTGMEFMKTAEGVIAAGGRTIELVALYRDGVESNDGIFADDVDFTPVGTRLSRNRTGDVHNALRALAKRLGGYGGMDASDLKRIQGYDAVLEVFARIPKLELRKIVKRTPWQLVDSLLDFAETAPFVRVGLAQGRILAKRQRAADRHWIASRGTAPSALGVNAANGGRVVNGGQLSTYRGEAVHFVPGEDLFTARHADDWEFTTAHADVDPVEATSVADRIIDGRLSDLMEGLVANLRPGTWVNVVYPDKGASDILTSRLAFRVSKELEGLGWHCRRSRLEVEIGPTGTAKANVPVRSVVGQLAYLDSVYDSKTAVAAISALKPVMTHGDNVAFATLAVDGSDSFSISDAALVERIGNVRSSRKEKKDGSESNGSGAPGGLHAGWEPVLAELGSVEVRSGAQPVSGRGEEATGAGVRRVPLRGLYDSLSDALGYDVRKTTGAELEGLVTSLAGGDWSGDVEGMRLPQAAERDEADDEGEDDEVPVSSYLMESFSVGRPIGRNKDAAVAYPDAAAEVAASLYSVGARRAQEIRRLFAKHRPDVDPADVMHYIEEIGKYENPKKEKLAVHWLIAGSIEIPEDNYKLDKAIKTAERAKVDPFLYRNPEDIFIAFPQHMPKDPAVDPDKVPELVNRTDMGHGIVVYDVDEEEQTSAMIGGEEVGLPAAQLAMRRIINTHWGMDASPWCLLQGNDMGGLTRDALMYWEHYNALPKRVAFKDGKLLSFMATDGGHGWGEAPVEDEWGEPVVPEEDFPEQWEEYEREREEQDALDPGYMPDFMTWMRRHYPEEIGETRRKKAKKPPEEWWDRKDASHPGIPFEGRVEGDPFGRSANQELRDGKAEIVGNLWKGNRRNGVYEEWTQEGQPVESSEWKDGVLHGHQIRWWPESGAMKEIGDYTEGKPTGDLLTFDQGGVPMSVQHFDGNGRHDRPAKFYYMRELSTWTDYDAEDKETEQVRYYGEGALSSYRRFDPATHQSRVFVDVNSRDVVSDVEFVMDDGTTVSLTYTPRLGSLDIAGVDFPDGRHFNAYFRADGTVSSYMLTDADGIAWQGGQWNDNGEQYEMTHRGHAIRYYTDGRKWDMRMPRPGSSQTYSERDAFTPEQLAEIPDEPMPKSPADLAERIPELKGVFEEAGKIVAEARARAKEVFDEDMRTRGFPKEPKFSTRLSKAKRLALLRPKSAIPQMEFDFYCDRKGITEQPKAEPPKAEPAKEEPKGSEPPKEEAQPKAEPPKKGKRYRAAVDDANAYQEFIGRYRPLFEAAVRRGEWKAALDFAEENHMPSASNVLKQYYRDPQFDMTELAGLKVSSVEDAAAILMTVRSPFVESVKAIYLDRQRKILDAKILTIGQIGRSAIAKGTVLRNMPPKTAFVILSHNHPSGEPSPSPEDKHLTMAIKKELKGAKVKLLDHIITDGDHFYSFNYQDILPVDVKTPKWEVLPAEGNMGTAFRTNDEVLKYAAAHLRDDGDCGHVIYLNRRLGVVGVRRIPRATSYADNFTLQGFRDEYAAWAKVASEGAESAAASSVILDLGPTTLDRQTAKKILRIVGPWFGMKGVEVADALCGSAEAGGIRSLRCDLEDGRREWKALVPNEEEVNNEDRFNYPKYSIASRRIDWEREPDSLSNVILSTTVAHLTGQDRNPEKYLYFKSYRDRGILDVVKPEVEQWANGRETHWFGSYLLAKYYGDLEAAKAVVRHHMKHKKVHALADFLKRGVDGGLVDLAAEPRPVRWLYVRNDDGRLTNRIPEAYAQLLAETFGGYVDTGIVKVSDERNTGATIKARVGREFQFAGEPEKEATYVIVDDVWTTGQTAVSLMEYLEKKGAKVAAITTLAVASNGSRVKPTGGLINQVLAKAHLKTVEEAEAATGVDLRRATGSELQAYLVKGKKGQWGLECWFGSAAPVLDLDFRNKGEKVTRATPVDLFAHLTADQRKHVTGKPTQGVFAFSTAFPHLSEMGDDQLIAAAHAVKVATKYLGRKMELPNYDAIKRDVAKAYPAATDDEIRTKTMTIQGDAVKLARKIREGLDKGVSESAILKALNDSMKPAFMGEMRNEARAGVKAGAYGAHAEEMLDRRLANTFDRAIRVQAGVDTDLFEEWAGVDFTETLWKVLHNAYAENQPAPRKPEPAIENPEEGGGSGASDKGKEPSAYTVKELENPRTFAEYIRDLAGKYWKETKGIGKDADPWQNRIAVQFLRKTAQNVYTKLVNEITYSRSRDTAYRAIQKMDNIPTVAGLVSQMAYVGEIIHARHIREKKQELCEKLENLLKTAFGATGRFKVDKEELKRKVTAEMELRARYMRHAMWLTPDAASEEAGELSRSLTAMATKYDEAERDLEQSRIYVETIRKLNILREFGGLKYKSVGEIETALAWWQEQAAGSSAEILRAFEDREARTKNAAAILAKAFFNPKMKHKIDKCFRQGMNNYLTTHMGFASLLQDMCRFAPEKDRAEAYRIIDYLSREIQKAGDRSAAEMRRHGDDFHKAVEQIYGMPFKKVMAMMNAEAPEFAPFMGTKGGHPIMPTKGRAMQLLVSLRQGARKDSNYYENVKHWKREGQAAQIADLLTPQDMNMLKWIGQWYEVNRQELSDVCEALFGIGVYSEAYNYFPVRMQLQKQGLEKVEGVAWTIFPKALTPRIRNLRDFDTETDIFALWASRMEEASQWKGHAKLGLELRGIFGRSELQEVVAANHGSRVNSLMLGFVTDILAGHGAYDRTTSGIEWWSDQIRGWTALCALGGNVGVTFKQTTSIPAFGFEIGLVRTAKYTVTAFTPAGMEAMKRIFASEQRKTRWQVGNTEAVKNALAKSDASWFKRAMQASMITNKVGDIVPGLVVGQGIYRDCLERGMSEENAMAETWMLIERTQQSGRMENQTSVQRRNRLGRMLYQFLTTQQQYLQYEVRAIRQTLADPSLKNAGQVANTILLNHLILSSLYYWMGELYKAMLGSEPPKDQIADWVVSCLLGPFASLYVLGFCSKVTLDRFLKGSWSAGGEDIMPMESFIKSTINNSARVIEAIFDEEKSTDDLVDELARLAAGLNPVVRDIRRVKQNMEE